MNTRGDRYVRSSILGEITTTVSMESSSFVNSLTLFLMLTSVTPAASAMVLWVMPLQLFLQAMYRTVAAKHIGALPICTLVPAMSRMTDIACLLLFHTFNLVEYGRRRNSTSPALSCMYNPVSWYAGYYLIEEVLSAIQCYLTMHMSQTQTAATKYNDANTDVRTTLLRSAKIEESQIATLAKSQFETLPKDVQNKLSGPVSSA
jgi:hypothetical protein